MNFIAKLFSSTALFVGGWREISKDTVEELSKPCKKVAVIAHTSYWDFFWGVMYGINYGVLHKIRFAMAPKPYDNFSSYPVIGSFIRNSCIRVIPKEERNGGCVQQIVVELNNMDDFIFVIAPVGTRTDDSEARWRSGFIHIARETGADLCVLGVDYSRHLHTCVMKQVESETEESLCLPNSEIRQLVSEYSSLNSEKEGVYNFDPVTVSTFVPFMTALTFFWLSFFGYLSCANMDIMMVTTAVFGLSSIHHSIGESNWEIMYIHTKAMIICHLWWVVNIYTSWPVTYITISLVLVCIHGFYLSGGHTVGWAENDEGELEYTPRDEFFESTTTYYNLMATSIILCLTKV